MEHDNFEQEIKYGDLVVFRRQYRSARMRLGRVIEVKPGKVKIVYKQSMYRNTETGSVLYPSYRISGFIDSCNCMVVEREFIQPELKEKIATWASKIKKPNLGEFLGMTELDIAIWASTRCIPIEK